MVKLYLTTSLIEIEIDLFDSFIIIKQKMYVTLLLFKNPNKKLFLTFTLLSVGARETLSACVNAQREKTWLLNSNYALYLIVPPGEKPPTQIPDVYWGAGT